MAGGDLRGEDMVFPAVLWAHIIRNEAQLYPGTIPYSSVRFRWPQGCVVVLSSFFASEPENERGGAQ